VNVIIVTEYKGHETSWFEVSLVFHEVVMIGQTKMNERRALEFAKLLHIVTGYEIIRCNRKEKE
jgi:hypothetical protein